MPEKCQFPHIVELPGDPYEPEIPLYNCLRHYAILGSTPGISKVRVKALRVPTLFPQRRCLDVLRTLLGNEWFSVQQHRHIAPTSFCKAYECELFPEVIPYPTVLVMHEYEGNILEYIDKYSGRISVAQKAQWLRQAADALCFLHAADIVHGNFYYGNILIDDKGAAVVADAGIYGAIIKYLVPDDVAANHLRFPNSLSCKSAEAVYTKGLRWRDPTMSDDIFAFAVTAWTVYSGKEPFPMHGETLRTVVQIGKKAHRGLERVVGMSGSLWNLLSIILAQEVPPSERPSLTKIISAL